MVISDLAAALLQGAGAAKGLMRPSPLVATDDAAATTAWWKANPMARVVPAGLEDEDAEALAEQPVASLKARLAERAVDCTGVLEKGELVALCVQSAAAEAVKRCASFRALGNVAGLCLLHHNVSLKLPLFFCRHVYKFLLGRKITFADFAFFDPIEDKVSRLEHHLRANTLATSGSR
jgi:hypothetical protein